MLTRRLFSFGLLAAPAIVRTPGLLMPVRRVRWPEPPAVVAPPGLSIGLFQDGRLVEAQQAGRYTVYEGGSISFPAVAFPIWRALAGPVEAAVLRDGRVLYTLDVDPVPPLSVGDTLVLGVTIEALA